jgi:hypothetical protein
MQGDRPDILKYRNNESSYKSKIYGSIDKKKDGLGLSHPVRPSAISAQRLENEPSLGQIQKPQ